MSLLRSSPAAALAVGAALVLCGTGHAQRGGRGGGFARPAVNFRPVPAFGRPALSPFGRGAPVRAAALSPAARRVFVGFAPGWGWYGAYPYWAYRRYGSLYPWRYLQNNYFYNVTNYYIAAGGWNDVPEVAPGYMPPADPVPGGETEAPADAPEEIPAPAPGPAPAPDEATVRVRLPDAQAVVWFNGKRMSAAGRVRVYLTPPLQPGKDYYYDVSAAWYEGGRLVRQQREVPVRPGGAVVVDFTRPARAAATGPSRR
jgi:uncharacterized protein (TIGR03000 family)